MEPEVKKLNTFNVLKLSIHFDDISLLLGSCKNVCLFFLSRTFFQITKEVSEGNKLWSIRLHKAREKVLQFGIVYYVAQGVLKWRSRQELDVWSITYILLYGRRPFCDKTEDGIFKEGTCERGLVMGLNRHPSHWWCLERV